MLAGKISLVSTHQLIVPSTLLASATEIRTHKATKIHRLKRLTYELFLKTTKPISSEVGLATIYKFSQS